jgi:hypothetical protein
MGRGPATAAIAVIAAFAAGSAPAASIQVAGPTPSGATLQAHHEDGMLCLTVMVSRGSAEDTCGEPVPRLASDAIVTYGQADGGRELVGVAAPQEVSRIQTVQADGTLSDAPARSAAREPEVTFFLAELDRRSHGAVRFVRLFDAGGTELEAVAGQDELPSSRPVTFAHVGPMRAVAYDAREFEPSPIEPERVRHYLCVDLRRAAGKEGLGGHCVSREAVSGAILDAQPSAGTCGHGDAVVAFARRRVTRMRLILGDGTAVVALPHDVPLDPPQGMRAFFAIAPREAALRRIDAFDAGGRRVGRQPFGLESATSACSSGLVNFGYFSPVDEAPAHSGPLPPGGPALAVRVDAGERLCVGADEAPLPASCFVPATGAVYAEAERRYDDGSRAFAGLVDPHVATVTAVLAGGRRITTATAAAPPGAGPYQAVSRGYLIHVNSSAVALVFADAQGHRLSTSTVDAGLTRNGRPRVVLRDGETRLAVARERHGSLAARYCAELLTTPGDPSIADCQTIDRRVSTAAVSCATHRIAIYGRLGQTPRAVEAITASGVHVEGQVDRRTRAFLIVLPAHEGLRELHVAGRRGYRSPHELPPGAEQCGYSASLLGSF